MSEIISTALGIYWIGYIALNSVTRPGSAVSSEAGVLSRAALVLIEATENSQVLFGDKATALSQLRALANECAEDDWDSNSGRALDPLSVWNAEAFLRVLPENLPLPEFAPEPDGSISIDWIVSRHRLFSLSISSSDRLSYAWIDGTDRGHGVAHFDGSTMPIRILQSLTTIIPRGTTTLRAA